MLVKTLRHALAVHGGPDIGAHRRVWRHVLSLSYILLPETREVWDANALRGHLALARTLAAAVVAMREDAASDMLWRLDLTDLGRVRAALHHRHAAELAVALTAAGRAEGHTLLDALGPPGRTAVGDIASHQPRRAKPARALLAAVPAPPPLTTHLAVLGPLAISRSPPVDGAGAEQAERSDAVLHRARVRALLGFLIGHRKTHRGAITAALWPDLDPQAANNNLGVTLNHLLRALEPWRRSGEPPYLIRLDGPTVDLRTGAHLRIDTDEFDHHVTSAARAETEGNATAALTHHLAAANLYRDDYLVELSDTDWLDLERGALPQPFHRQRHPRRTAARRQGRHGPARPARPARAPQRPLERRRLRRPRHRSPDPL